MFPTKKKKRRVLYIDTIQSRKPGLIIIFIFCFIIGLLLSIDISKVDSNISSMWKFTIKEDAKGNLWFGLPSESYNEITEMVVIE